ncbi:hypothetical protein AGOR_G00026480 [Albula goreensis]|uniref:Ig-like domain-containing protein n=1 Tax=Albula goreensis TaxID=1534307 RepID=A0A8T3E1K0_9TELE|nr:hypothetical protein AGOR_G00026480 [Albula goreensis]
MREISWTTLLLIYMGCCPLSLAQAKRTGQPNTDLRGDQPPHIRAAIGGSVTLSCSFNYTGNQKDIRVGKFLSQTHRDLKENVHCRPLISKEGPLHCNFSLTISNIHLDNQTVYYCEVQIPRMEGSITVKGGGTRLSLYSEASSVRIQPPSQLVSGRNAILTCEASGFYPQNVSVLWFHRGALVPQGKVTNVITRGRDGTFSLRSQYRFTPNMADDMAECLCQVSHSTWLHWKNASETLVVAYGPSAVNVSSDSGVVRHSALWLVAGSPLKITCSADGRPSPLLQWLKGTKKTQNMGESFQATAVQEEDGGRYWCVATNLYGERNASIDVRVSPSNVLLKNLGLMVLCGFGVILIFFVPGAFAHLLSKKKSQAQPLAGHHAQDIISHAEQATSQDEIYSTLKVSTKRKEQPVPSSRPVDGTQMIYAEIMFPLASRHQNTMKVEDSPIYSSVVLHSTAGARGSTRGNSLEDL